MERVERRRVVEGVRNMGRLRIQRLLHERKRPLVGWLGAGVPAQGLVEHRLVVEAHRHIGMLRPQRLLHDR